METNVQQRAQLDFRLWLQSQLTDRCRKNPRYSLRSFAQLLDLEPSSLSKILAGKRKPTVKIIQKICEKLSVTPAVTDRFLKESKTKKIVTEMPNADENFVLMAEDAFAYISSWYHVAILELTYTDMVNDPQWIAQALAITTSEAKIAIERLLRLGLLKEENEKLIKTNKFLTNFTPGFTSGANKEFQRQIISKSLEAIDYVAADEKDITSMTMAIDVDKLPEARKIITKFRRDMCAFLEDGEQTRVYNLGIQLYPISKPITKNDGV